MKTCLRLTFFLCLLLPTFLTAQGKPVQVANPCLAGSPFTIRIPVRFPAGMTVQYRWYRNDIAVTEKITLTAGEKIIAYTVPDTEAYGDSEVFHFVYWLDDGLDCWTASRKYAVRFLPDHSCNEGGIEGDEVDLISCRLSGGGGIEGDDVLNLSCKLNSGGSVEGDNILNLSCKLSSGGGVEGDDVPDLSCKLSNGGSIGSE